MYKTGSTEDMRVSKISNETIDIAQIVITSLYIHKETIFTQ